jgi:hypothetical protein
LFPFFGGLSFFGEAGALTVGVGVDGLGGCAALALALNASACACVSLCRASIGLPFESSGTSFVYIPFNSSPWSSFSESLSESCEAESGSFPTHSHEVQIIWLLAEVMVHYCGNMMRNKYTDRYICADYCRNMAHLEDIHTE